jgi:hypothetical protein
MSNTPDPTELLRAVLGLPPAERAAVLAECDPELSAKVADAADWTPLTKGETHRAYQAATACIAARYYRLPVRFADLIDDQEPRHLIWVLATTIADSLRHFPDTAIVDLLRQWGALAAEGVANSDRPDQQNRS